MRALLEMEDKSSVGNEPHITVVHELKLEWTPTKVLVDYDRRIDALLEALPLSRCHGDIRWPHVVTKLDGQRMLDIHSADLPEAVSVRDIALLYAKSNFVYANVFEMVSWLRLVPITGECFVIVFEPCRRLVGFPHFVAFRQVEVGTGFEREVDLYGENIIPKGTILLGKPS